MKARFLNKQFRSVFQKAKRIAKASYMEICGFIIDNGHFFHLHEAKNKSKKPGKFSFYTSEVRKIENAVKILGYNIVGTFHSHPLGFPVPGPNDIKFAEENDLMLIFDCIGREAKLWRIRKNAVRQIIFELF